MRAAGTHLIGRLKNFAAVSTIQAWRLVALSLTLPHGGGNRVAVGFTAVGFGKRLVCLLSLPLQLSYSLPRGGTAWLLGFWR